MIIKLRKRFQYEGYDLTEVDLNFEGAPANIIRKADAKVSKMNYVPQMKQMDTLYCGTVASLLTGIPYEVLESMPLPDFNTIINAVSLFLLTSEEAREETLPLPSEV